MSWDEWVDVQMEARPISFGSCQPSVYDALPWASGGSRLYDDMRWTPIGDPRQHLSTCALGGLGGSSGTRAVHHSPM
eukprot:scaffold1889_cov108-Isochrysis_galbana.AAC.4